MGSHGADLCLKRHPRVLLRDADELIMSPVPPPFADCGNSSVKDGQACWCRMLHRSLFGFASSVALLVAALKLVGVVRERAACFLDRIIVPNTPGSTLFNTSRTSPCRDRAHDPNLNTNANHNPNYEGVETQIRPKKRAVLLRIMRVYHFCRRP